MTLATNLVSHWKLEDTSDSVGAHTLTNTGSISFANVGKINNGATFVGSNASYLKIATPFIDLSPSVGVTMSCWFQPNTTGANSIVLGFGSSANARSFQFIMPSSTTIKGFMYGGSAGLYSTATATINASGTWYHLALTKTTSDVISFYLNSILIGTVTASESTGSTRNGMEIGIEIDGGPTQAFTGMVDEVSLWSRALSADEVSQVYNSGRANAYPFTDTPSLYGATAYYKLDESSGNAADSIGTNTLTNTNTVTYVAGKVNNGANFVSASSQYLTAVHSAALNPIGACTFNAWVYLATAATMPVFGKWDDSSTSMSYLIRVDGSGNQIIWNSRDSGGTNRQTSVSWTPATSTWYMVTVVFDGTGNTLFYVNGSQQGATQSSSGTSIIANTLNFQLGRQASNSSSYMNGRIDEASIWSRALSSADISVLYGGGTGTQYPLFASSGTFNALTLGTAF